MGRQPATERKYKIERMWEIHKEIARRVFVGQTNIDIAQELNVTPAMVGYTRNSPIVKRQLDEMGAARDIDCVDVAKRIEELAPYALDTLEALLASDHEAMQFKVATDLLDRAGHGAVKNINLRSSNLHLTADDLSDIKSRARQVGIVPMEVMTNCGI